MSLRLVERYMGEYADPARVMFLYWGRRGLTQFALEVARAALADPRVCATISVSRQNESFETFTKYRKALFPIDTFVTNLGVMTRAWHIPVLYQQLSGRLKKDRTQAVIELMPHVWSPFIAPAIRASGARYITIVHDVDIHPGDYRTAFAKCLLDRAAMDADLIYTLSETVTKRLVDSGRYSKAKIQTLFHPDLLYTSSPMSRKPRSGRPFRLLFLGRILPYKGLSLFVDAVEILLRQNVPIEVGVFGEGALGESGDKLKKLGAEVVNRWLTDSEISAVLRRFDVMVLSHIEASQSGIAATALGAGLPIVATPVGGLVEQVKNGQTGLLSAATDAPSFARAIATLYQDSELYLAICNNIHKSSDQRSMNDFVWKCVSRALNVGDGLDRSNLSSTI